MMSNNSPTIDNSVGVDNTLGNPYNVLLFNDSIHSFDSVVVQIVKATHCSGEKAEAIAFEAHSKGQAVAFTGHRERCELVDQILAGAPLKLKTDIQPC